MTILLMTGILFVLVTGFLWNVYRQSGEALTIMTHANIQFGLDLPEQALEHIAQQMTVSALLTAELVDIAENEAGFPPEAIRDRLNRVIERSRDQEDLPLVDEFWITDAEGYADIRTEPTEFDFREGDEQSDAFMPLLEGETTPVLQSLRRRALDGRPFLYVGVPGVDHARIVQLGASAERAQAVARDFGIQELIEEFVLDIDAARIVVMDGDGTMLFGAVHPEGFLDAPLDPELARWMGGYLERFRDAGKPGFFPAEVRRFGADVGVLMPLRSPRIDRPLALFIQHRTIRAFRLLELVYLYMIGIGAVMVVLAMAGAFHMSRRLSQPITALATSVRRFGEGDLDHRVAPQSDAEFHGLAQAFNGMAQSLQTYTEELRQQTAHRERLESEMRIGAEVQQSLLPKRAPAVDGLEMCGFSRQASQVGGDFYDYIEQSPTLLGVCIGDATGHGLSSALLVSECWSVLRAYASDDPDPGQLLFRTNNALCKRLGRSGRFVTLFAMQIDLEQRCLRYAVAGHNPPYLVRAAEGTPQPLNGGTGLPLGILPDGPYETQRIDLTPGDLIFCYSDGLTEALSATDALYTEGRLEAQLAAHHDASLEGLIETLHADVLAHIQERPPADDITMVAVRVGGRPGAPREGGLQTGS